MAQEDRNFAATAGACFGGLEINPAGILSAIWTKTAESLLHFGPQSMFDFLDGTNESAITLQESAGWMMDSWESLLHDPFWHAGWMMDVQRKWVHTLSVMNKRLPDPRIKGVV